MERRDIDETIGRNMKRNRERERDEERNKEILRYGQREIKKYYDAERREITE